MAYFRFVIVIWSRHEYALYMQSASAFEWALIARVYGKFISLPPFDIQ